jgi:hypothetical protein
MADLTGVPTGELVAEAMRRAPACPEHRIPMVLLRPAWFACPVCGRTNDYVAVAGSATPTEENT